MKVCVLGDSGHLGGRVASAFGVVALGLNDVPPDDCDGVVIVVGTEPTPGSRPLVDMPEAEWRDAAESAPWRAIRALQRARTATLPRRGDIVVLVPSAGLIGAEGLSHYVAGIEAVRAMAKSAARQWAAEHISVSLIAVPLGVLVEDATDLVRHVGSAARKDADLSDAVVRAVEFILAGAGPALTGSTLVIDGGAVMAP